MLRSFFFCLFLMEKSDTAVEEFCNELWRAFNRQIASVRLETFANVARM